VSRGRALAAPLYNLTLTLAAPLGASFLAWRLLTRPEYRAALGERFGAVAPSPKHCRVIWIHAVSVGEVIAAVPLVKATRESFPEAHLVVSCGTPTGRATALERLAGVADRVIYLAYDLAPLARAAVVALDPDLMVLVETELWPNLLHILGRRGTPVMLVNGRISRRSFPRYLRFRPLLRVALEEVSRFLMQTPRDAGRVRRMGAPRERVEVVGNLKYDQPLPPDPGDGGAALRAALGIPEGAPVVLAGSTHQGEETALAAAWKIHRETHPDLVLILAIRHPHRADAVVRDLQTMGIRAGCRSRGEGAAHGVVLLDTVGELAAHYRIATVAFVGGSLVPVGGHNPLEPAALGIPVVYGPHMHNFTAPCAALEGAGAALRLVDEAALAGTLNRLLGDPAARQTMGDAGQAVFAHHRGAVARTVARMRQALE